MGGLALFIEHKSKFSKEFASELNTINLRHFQTDGKLLRVFTTTFFWKHLKGPQLTTVPNGKNVKNWTIRNQAPNVKIMVTVQRLNVSEEFIYSLRYSLVPLNIPKGRVLTIPIKYNTSNYTKKIEKNYFNKNY